MNDRVRITEVSPRDGLQNEAAIVPAAAKAELVRRLSKTGVDEVEVSSFVSPKWIPQLGDAAEVFAAVAADKPEGLVYSALVPNDRGLDRALEVNESAQTTTGAKLIDRVAVFTAASETFSQKNTNASIEETLERFEPVFRGARAAGLGVRGYISCVVACPYEGAIEPDAVTRVAERLMALGADEIDLGDTIGAADESSMDTLLSELLGSVAELSTDRPITVTMHLHDTFGRAAACARVAMELGVRSFDGAVSGLGGCPFASTPGHRAPGNISTGTLLDVVEELGLSHGVNRAALDAAARFAAEALSGAQNA